MENNSKKIAPKKCANCGATLEVDSSKEMVMCPYCRASFNVSELLDESDEVKIEKIKSQTYKDIETQKLQHEIDKENKKEIKENIENFKKSKLKKWLVPCAIISGICSFACFSTGDILAGLIALVQMAAYITSLLMGYQVIKEKIKYMRVLVAIVGFVLIIPFMGAFGGDSSSSSMKAEKINWEEFVLSKKLPKPNSNKAIIGVDSEKTLSIKLEKVSKAEYKSYEEKCKKKGYSKVVYDNEESYKAFDKDGYDLSLLYYEDNMELDISLFAPMKMSEIEWPDSKVAKLLPKPKSKQGNVISDTSEDFDVYIGKTSEADYKDYVKACSEKEFNKDYDKGESSYSAKNKDGYQLSLSYEKSNIMHISIDMPESEEDSEDEEESENINKKDDSDKKETKKDTKESKKKESSSLVDPDFKKAMDSYEKFFDEYIEFMEKYSKSNNSIAMLADYTEYMEQYTETMKKIEKIDEDKLSDADRAYYIKVYARITKKLAEVSN